MRFYHALYDTASKRYLRGAAIAVLSWQLKSITAQNSQGDTISYDGKFVSPVQIQRGALVAAESNARVRFYRIASRDESIGGLITYYLSTESGGSA
jgi:hypothetical protein